MFLNNPFLILELRQHARRWETVQAWTAGIAALLASPVLVAMFLHENGFDQWPLWDTTAIRWLHVGICAGVGWLGGMRVYHAEKHAGTLEAVLLLPYSPAAWLTRKLALPLLLGATGVALALPVYLAAVVLDMDRMSELPLRLGQSGAAAVAGLCVRLLTPPRIAGPPPLSGSRVDFTTQEALQRLLVILLIVAVIFTSAGRLLHSHGGTILFGVTVPFWPLWAGMTALVLTTTACTAATPLAPDVWERRALALLVASCLVLYHVALGVFWQRLPLPARLALLLLAWGVVALNLVTRSAPAPQVRHAPEPEEAAPAVEIDSAPDTEPDAPAPPVSARKRDEAVARELCQIATRSQNPLLLLDCRIHARQGSQLHSAIGSLVILVASVGGLRWFTGNWSSVQTLLTGGVWGLLLSTFTNVGTFAGTVWQKEAATNSLAPLLLTPLTSREIVTGRLLAGAYRSLGYALGTQLPLGIAVCLVAPSVTAKLLPGVLALLPLLLTSNLCTGFHFRAKGIPRPPMATGERIRYWIVWLFHALGIAGCFASMKLGIDGKSLTWTIAAVGFLLHTIAARWMYQLKIRRLEAIRQTDFTGVE